MAIISLDGMRFYANHGCFAEEQAIGADFVVDLKLNVDTLDAQQSDDISATVSYQDVYNLVSSEMSCRSHLLEHVASRIASSVLARFPKIRWISVRVSKLNPPLGGQLDSASVTLFLRR